jgi:hypothetical protein
MSQLTNRKGHTVPTPTTPTTFHLTAITDDSISKTHLGAKEREPGKTWCGVQLLVKDDTRFGGRYKDIVWSEVVTPAADGGKATPALDQVDCGACKRSAAWKAHLIDGATVYKLPPPKAPADRKPPTPRGNAAASKMAAQAKAAAAKGKVSANEAQEIANRAADAQAEQAAKPSTRKGPREKAAAKDAAKLAAEQVSGSSVIEADPDTGLPRIKPDVQAKADAIAAEQVAKNEQAAADAAALAESAADHGVDLTQVTNPDEFIATVTDILDGAK